MKVKNAEPRRSFGHWLLDRRQPIGLALVIVTLFMSYCALHVPIATKFEDLFPANHPSTILYRQFRSAYGGAQTLVVMIRVRNGDIFNTRTLHAIQDITDKINSFDGVNHNEVFSLSSYRVLYARALPGVLESAPFMYPKVPEAPVAIAALKNNVQVNQEQLAGLITRDLKGALIIASFNEGSLDYKDLFDGVQQIIRKYQDSETAIYASGPVMFTAWGYHYLARLKLIFAASLVLMVALTCLCLERRAGWWAPIATGICSAIWGVGFMSLRGYNFDPVMLVIPLIMTARDVGHGIQWQGRFYHEMDQGEGKIGACAAAADRMLRPGVIAILIGVAGIAFFTLSDIPVLKQLGLGGAVWLGSSLIVVLAGQPILISYLAIPANRGRVRPLKDENQSALARLATITVARGAPRSLLIGAGIGATIVGLLAFPRVRIGYQAAGTPIYRAAAKINQDTAEISRFVPANLAWVVLETPEYPSPQSTMGTQTMRMVDDLAAYLVGRGDVMAVIGFGNVAEKPMNMLLHHGSPKFFAIPNSEMLSAALWNFFFGSSAPDEPKAYFAFVPSARNGCVRLLLPDHTSARLRRLRADLDQFVRDRVTPDHQLSQVRMRYLGGEAGLYLAIDDVTTRLNLTNLALVLSAIFLVSAIFFGSVAAGALLTIVSVMANFVAFIFMNHRVIGLTVDTIPVISLGIGLGLSFAIYLLAAIAEKADFGLSIDEAIVAAIAETGRPVLNSFIVIVGGLAPWVFSPMLFQNEMSVILVLLMSTNLAAALIIMPALISWVRPRFLVRREERVTKAAERRSATPI